jgi:hypothetical protein
LPDDGIFYHLSSFPSQVQELRLLQVQLDSWP